MARQRGELVSVGDALSGMDGPGESAPRRLAPGTARLHRCRSSEQLVGASEADPDLGFMARLMALCSLPRTNPGNRHQYKRVNGPYKLGMTAGLDNKLPYGNFPRLLLAWVSTEAVRTQSRVLVLGDSLSDFMRALGVYSAGGGNAGIKLRNQMRRLFNAHIQLVYEDEHGEASVSSSVTDSTELWWNVRKPGERSLWDSKIELSEKFFQEIIRHPVPLDMNILKSLKRSTLGLDLYLWLTYRTFALRAPLRLSWRQVYCQFGAHPDKSSEQQHRSSLPVQGSPRTEEDQARLAGSELHHGQGRPDPASLDPRDSSFRATSASKLSS